MRERKVDKGSRKYSLRNGACLEMRRDQERGSESGRDCVAPLVVVTRQRCHNFTLTVRRRRGFQLFQAARLEALF